MSAPRRSARIAAQQEAPTLVAAPAPKSRVKKVRDLGAERAARYQRLIKEDPTWAEVDARRQRWREVRTSYKSGARLTDEQKKLAELVDATDALKERVLAATSVEHYEDCAAAADALWEAQREVEWRDQLAEMFITDCHRYCKEAVKWLQHEGGEELISSSLEDAQSSALRTIEAFKSGMF